MTDGLMLHSLVWSLVGKLSETKVSKSKLKAKILPMQRADNFSLGIVAIQRINYTPTNMGGFRGGRGGRAPPPSLFSCIFEKFLTLSLTFGHKCSQNDVKQHHQFLRPPLSGFSGSVPD